MGNIIKLSVILMIVSGLSAGILAFFNLKTSPIIAKMAEKSKEEARFYVMPNAKRFEEISFQGNSGSNESYCKAFDKDDKFIGYVFSAKGPGYSGIVETMVGADTTFKIVSIKVLKQTETPGLGAECKTVKYGEKNPYFENWFKNLDALSVVVVKDDKNSPNKVESLTGSTITTRAVCKSIREYAKMVKEASK